MKKIIISSIVVGLILILGVTTIILAVVPVGFNQTIARPNEITIVYSKTKDLSPDALVYRDRNEDDVKIISNLYSTFCHAFEQKALSAIFNGEMNKGVEENYLNKGSKSISNNRNEDKKITICFKYSTNKKIKDYSYKYLFFEITNANERDDQVFAVSSSYSATSFSNYYNYYYSGKANFSSLFNYIETLV